MSPMHYSDGLLKQMGSHSGYPKEGKPTEQYVYGDDINRNLYANEFQGMQEDGMMNQQYVDPSMDQTAQNQFPWMQTP